MQVFKCLAGNVLSVSAILLLHRHIRKLFAQVSVVLSAVHYFSDIVLLLKVFFSI